MNNSDYENLLQQLRKDLVPIGSIIAFPSKNVPDGYLPCEGQELSVRLYPELYELIGHTWGGDKFTFYLPDLQGQFIRGWDREGDVDPEREFGKLQMDAIQGHSHSVKSCDKSGCHYHKVGYFEYNCDEANTFFSRYTHSHVTDYSASGKKKYTGYDGEHSHNIVLGDVISSTKGPVRGANESRPTNVALIFCIKVK